MRHLLKFPLTISSLSRSPPLSSTVFIYNVVYAAANVWNRRGELRRPKEARGGDSQRQQKLPESGLVVLAGCEWVYSRGSGPTPTVCHRVLSATSGRVQGPQSKVSDHLCSHPRPPALRTHLVSGCLSDTSDYRSFPPPSVSTNCVSLNMTPVNSFKPH